MGVAAFVYLVTACCDPAPRYFLHITTCADVYDYMEKLFYEPMSKVMRINCYHMETQTTTMDSPRSGSQRTHTTTTRVNTHSAKKAFRYTSWRDVSGEFAVNVGGASANQERAFIRLRLELKMSFVNDGTGEDFERQKAEFIRRNDRDVMYEYSDCLELKGYREYSLVRVSDTDPKFFGFTWYLLSTLLTLSEFYKMYMDRFCIDQEFNIVKMVSSRQDINAPQVIHRYEPMVPRIVYGEHEVVYDGPMILPPNMWEGYISQGSPIYKEDDAPLIKH
eukprot:TRINITY_DN8411_c0_g2_i4.p1 TRINITY_DN8411_c0_g2~~TRINITY_DN8411_c0_g2_i4.p1  ORF type:complete len:277 (+),score=41.51 TRINITY_DN8411_c0_g2_i4:46-876(+)